jgi:hypothetical protein
VRPAHHVPWFLAAAVPLPAFIIMVIDRVALLTNSHL